MTISSYQVDNVIKAYNKQQKTKGRFVAGPDPIKDRHADMVTLSGENAMGKEAFTKISYNLLDIIAKQKK